MKTRHGTMMGIALLAAMAGGALLVGDAGESVLESPRASPEGSAAETEIAVFALG